MLLFAAIAELLVSLGIVSSARCTRTAGKAVADTLIVNTTDLCKDVIGYDGPTPLKITIVKGVVARSRRFRTPKARVTSSAFSRAGS